MSAPIALPMPSILELPPEMTGGLTFHLPMEVMALQDAGAASAIIEERIAAGLAEAYRTGLVDPPFYRWAVEHHRAVADALLSTSADERAQAFASVVTLGDGLVGAAFHGLIRTGYAAMRGDAAELARGLAYLRTRRQVLQGSGPAGTGAPTMPTADELDGTTVFDQLSLAAGAGGADELADASRPLPHAADLLRRAADLLRHDAGSFVSVHAVTGLHGLAELHHLVVGEPPAGDLDGTPLASWWRAYAIGLRSCTLLVHATPHVGRTDCAPHITSTAGLLAAAVDSGDTHSVKLAVALTRLARFGLVDEPTTWELGALKLGVDECRM